MELLILFWILVFGSMFLNFAFWILNSEFSFLDVEFWIFVFGWILVFVYSILNCGFWILKFAFKTRDQKLKILSSDLARYECNFFILCASQYNSEFHYLYFLPDHQVRALLVNFALFTSGETTVTSWVVQCIRCVVWCWIFTDCLIDRL